MDKSVSAPTESDLPAGTGANPGRVSERTRWVGVTLARGMSLDGRADRLDGRLILGLEDIRHRTGGQTVAVMRQVTGQTIPSVDPQRHQPPAKDNICKTLQPELEKEHIMNMRP